MLAAPAPPAASFLPAGSIAHDFAHPIDVPADQMAAQTVRQAQRLLQVDRIAGAKPVVQLQRLLRHIDVERIRPQLTPSGSSR